MLSADRPRIASGATTNMVLLPADSFLMGSDATEVFPADGEGPVRRVTLDSFYISRHAVTNFEFAEFVDKTAYATEAERFGWSLAFRSHVPELHRGESLASTPWWLRVNGACWKNPEGPESSVVRRELHPVVHVSWNDAQAFCAWRGVRLPTEAEWEYAARGGLEQKRYPWGDDLKPAGRHMCNIWQGAFPQHDLAEDGFTGTSPATAFDPNAFGLHCAVGNTWEWCADVFDRDWHASASLLNPVGPAEGDVRTLKGGSFLCHASYCFRYRNAARTGNEPDSSTAHIGFRTARDLA